LHDPGELADECLGAGAGVLPGVWRGWRDRLAAGSYDVDAAFMSFYVHDRGIHAV
jgi:hypothetical protein